MLIPIIGLEIHVRLKTRSKLFCACATVDDSAPINSSICPVCTGQPGALPALNQEAVRLGVRAGLALGCRVPDEAYFDRKNYFYPDLPKGYQISQYDFPLNGRGEVCIDVAQGKPPRDRIRIGITRAHLEEDAAKNIHDGASNATLVDFNRAGSPLLEIVTEPDLRSPLEAKTFLQELQAILRAVDASDADMEKGFMRCDANISMLDVDPDTHQPLSPGYNPKTEVKNLNSFRAVERALAFEIERQSALLRAGERLANATRGWDENHGQTFQQRSKETNADYRYFPEPDLRPLRLHDVREQETARVPELPEETRQRLVREWGFSPDDARFFVANPGWADFADRVMSELGAWLESTDVARTSGGDILAERQHELAKLAGGWLSSKLAGLLTQKAIAFKDMRIDAENFAEFLELIDAGAINSANAQKLLLYMLETGADPSHLMEEYKLGQTNDPALIENLVRALIGQNPDQAGQVRAGKTPLVKWFVGCVMKSTEGRANPTLVEAEVKKQLGV